MRADVRIAITGATSTPGKTVRGALADRKVPAESVRLLEQAQDEAILSEYAGQAMLVGALEPDAFDDRDLVFLCGGPEESVRCLGWVHKPGTVVVDLSGTALSRSDEPIVNTEVNPDALRGGRRRIGAPHPVSFALTCVLDPIERALGVERAEAVVLRPVSDFGEPGIEELHRQTVGILNFTEIPKTVFRRQMAFNLLPQSGVETEEMAPKLESRIDREVCRIFEWAVPRTTVRMFVAPVFIGHALAVHVTLKKEADAELMKKALRGGKRLVVGTAPGGGFSPVEAAGGKKIRIAEVASDSLGGAGFWLWILGGDLPAAAADNAAEIAGRLLSG